MGGVFGRQAPAPAPKRPRERVFARVVGCPGAGVSSFVHVLGGEPFGTVALQDVVTFVDFRAVVTDGVKVYVWDDPYKQYRLYRNAAATQKRRVQYADVLALAVDLSSPQLDGLRWELAQHREASRAVGVAMPPVVVLGLKADLPRAFGTSLDELAAELGGAAAAVEVSAKEGTGVAEAARLFAQASPARRLRPRLTLVYCRRRHAGGGGPAEGWAGLVSRLPEHLFRRVVLFV